MYFQLEDIFYINGLRMESCCRVSPLSPLSRYTKFRETRTSHFIGSPALHEGIDVHAVLCGTSTPKNCLPAKFTSPGSDATKGSRSAMGLPHRIALWSFSAITGLDLCPDTIMI